MQHQPRKRFGQNFLRDEHIIFAIAQAISPQQADHLVEIGPGDGALTESLLVSGCRLDAVELDHNLSARLLAAFSIYPLFTLHNADALRFDFGALARKQKPIRLVGNLPYNISTPLLIKLLEDTSFMQDMHFMLQLEVVQRLSAKPGNKFWGRLGVLTQFRCEVEPLLEVPPEAFYPAPRVQSALIRLIPRSRNPWPNTAPIELSRVVAHCFAKRRKTIRNNLKGFLSDADFEQLAIDPNARAESLTLRDFISLTEHFKLLNVKN